MSVNSRAAVLVFAVCLVSFCLPEQVYADAPSELAAAEEAVSTATADLAADEQRFDEESKAFAPLKKKINNSLRAAKEQLAAAELKRKDMVQERRAAQAQVAAATEDYEDEQDQRDLLLYIGVGTALLAVALAAGLFILRKRSNVTLKRDATYVAGAVLACLFIGGIALAVLPSDPSPPEFPPDIDRLAKAAEGNPLRPPRPDVVKEFRAVGPLLRTAKELQAEGKEPTDRLTQTEEAIDQARQELAAAKREYRSVQKVVEHEEEVAAEEVTFKEEATTIDFDQLNKNPFRYVGEKVVYTGQIFQIQEGFGSFMLLSVTDEGYGFWTDEIWVSGFGHIAAAEEDIVTVYGTVSGAEEYETQIGGSRYVPKVKARYVEE